MNIHSLIHKTCDTFWFSSLVNFYFSGSLYIGIVKLDFELEKQNVSRLSLSTL